MRKILIILIMAVILQSCAGTKAEKKSSVPAVKEPSVIITGDIMIARKLAPIAAQYGIDYPFENISEEFNRSEIVFGNLEEPLVYEKNVQNLEKNGEKSVYLYDTEKTAEGLKNAGFNIVSLANNHILDYGQYGLTQTVEILDDGGIKYCGLWSADNVKANVPCVMQAGGSRVAFLCYSQVSDKQFAAGRDRIGTIPGVKSVIMKDIKECRKNAGIVIVYLHWGREYMPVDGRQRYLARQIINAGADMVVGSHTHIFQDIEKYKGKYIFYGLGNFIFDLEREETKNSGYITAKIKGGKIDSVTVTPVYLKDYRPVIVTDRDAVNKFIKSIKFKGLEPSEVFGQ